MPVSANQRQADQRRRVVALDPFGQQMPSASALALPAQS
jgi:hypothetical protein